MCLMRILLFLKQAKPELSSAIGMKLHVEDVVDFLLFDNELMSATKLSGAPGEESNEDHQLVT